MEPLELTHEKQISEQCGALALSLSEYSFANLYLFRKVHEYHLFRWNQLLFVHGKSYDGAPYLMPLFKPTEELLLNIKQELPAFHCFFPIPEEWLHDFSSERFSYDYKEADSDYLFSIEKMAYYPGRRLSKKRNLVKQFLDNYAYTTAPLGGAVDDAIQVLDKWQSRHALGEIDIAPCLEALQLFDRLHLQGKLYYINNSPKGFIIAGPINADTIAIHFMKGDTSCKGLYQFMYQDFLKSFLDQYAWVNLEQDLGNEQLRQAKHSYQPDCLHKKFRISFRRIM